MNTFLAVSEADTSPGWGKLAALVIAVGAFWVFMQVHKRWKAVREGEEINPFSPEVTGAGEVVPAEVTAPLEGADKGPRKGWGKWLRKG